jgi:hypothetical protein
VTIRPLDKAIATPPVLRNVGASSLSHFGVQVLGRRRSLTTMSAERHATASCSIGN